MPYKNAEKRKEKSRDAARNRRGKEADVFAELSSLVPVKDEVVAAMDKSSIMRLAICSLKIRTLMKKTQLKKQSASDATLNREHMRALGGFLVLLDEGGDIMYASPDVTGVLGLSQLDLLGSSLFEFTHPCDHDELTTILGEKDADEDCRSREHTFFLRHKCTLTSKGRNVNLKSASYKVIRYTGHHLQQDERACLVLIGEGIPQPSNTGLPPDSFSFLSQHSMDLVFTYCDDRIKDLLGYSAKEVMGRPMFEYLHAWDGEHMDKSFKGLYSKGQMWTERYRMLAKGGGYVWTETQATVIQNSKTDKPQFIICVHYVLSGVEQHGVVMSEVQIKSEPCEISEPRRAIKEEPVSSSHCRTDSGCTVRNKPFTRRSSARSAMGCGVEARAPMPHAKNPAMCGGKGASMVGGYNLRPAGVDESLMPMLDPDEVEVATLLEDMLFSDNDMDLRPPYGSMIGAQPNPPLRQPMNNVSVAPVMPETAANKSANRAPGPCSVGVANMPFATSLASLIVNDGGMEDETNEGIPNLEHLADNPKRSPGGLKRCGSVSSGSDKPELDDVDMDMRAPYIPMSGDEDLIFSMVTPVPLIDEMDSASNMLGTTETIFTHKPENPEEEKVTTPFPMCIMRQEAMEKEKKRMMSCVKNDQQTMWKLSEACETSRLETGPPDSKRLRLDQSDDDSALYYNVATNMNMQEVTRGSMVLKNLLVAGQDPKTGYDIYNWNNKKSAAENPEQPKSATLRGLLTGPMENLSPPLSPTKSSVPATPASDRGTPTSGYYDSSPAASSNLIPSNSSAKQAAPLSIGSTPVQSPYSVSSTVSPNPVAAPNGQPRVTKCITLCTTDTPTSEANKIVLTDDIIRKLIQTGTAQVTFYNA